MTGDVRLSDYATKDDATWIQRITRGSAAPLKPALALAGADKRATEDADQLPMMRYLGLLVFVLALLAPRYAHAQLGCEELPCSVNRNCSSTGIACEPGDRACTGDATSRNLEVKCEQQCTAGTRLVYCPPDTGRSDSRVVWLLLSMAVVLAVAGSTVTWLALRKKSA